MKLGFKVGLMAALMVGVALSATPFDAEAKRLGGSRSSGTQRQAPDKPVQKAPAQEATPNAAPGAAAAAPGAAAAAAAPAAAARRNWTGPLMGLAAGLGLAALFSHLGMGEGFASVMMMLLIGMVAFGLLRWFMSRRKQGAGSSLAMAGAGAGAAGAMGKTGVNPFSPVTARTSDTTKVEIGSALSPAMPVQGRAAEAAAADGQRFLPADFDTAAFERIAKTVFIRMQAANDARNLDDLRAFTTPEMFAELRTDLMDRGDAAQTTDVVSVNPTVIDFAEEGDTQIVSVRYVGVIREQADGPAESFDEVWHLSKARDGGNAWRIAGIQQRN